MESFVNKSWVLSALLAAGPVTAASLLPATVLASPANKSIIGSRQVRIGIRIARGANNQQNIECTPSLAPNLVTLEVLDATTLEVLQVGNRWYSSETSSSLELKDSMTTSCRLARYQFKKVNDGAALQLLFQWDQQSPFAVTGVGVVDIHENAIFKLAR